mmetsp:Transcript_876/g.3226  ORF Transcript_876/g.3226 Transcript_876/m.3226 type:complete len:506 (+) Transcript_876:19-1536(+)
MADPTSKAEPAPKAIFVFPQASGHVNPSLPLARALVSQGWAVEYLLTPQFKEAIEDTGATFFDRDDVCAEFGVPDLTAMVKGTFAEYDDAGALQWALNFGSIAAERLLPVYISWFRDREPHLVVYCPVLCQVAHFAALKLGIPDVSLLTASGPGFFDAAIAAAAGQAAVRGYAAGLVASIAANKANAAAAEAIRATLGLDLTLNTAEPLISDYYTAVNIVSTTAELADPMCAEDEEHYRAAGKTFAFVGPLLDVAGAKRAAGALQNSGQQAGAPAKADRASVLDLCKSAGAAGRPVVYVSMGTVITGDNEDHGWEATSGSALTGRQLCQAVYRAVFEELGGNDEQGSALIVVSLGQQPDALEGVDVPANAVCRPRVPQVDLLRASKPVLFVTNGGQNSVMESMAVGTPLVVCPGFGDQTANAAKVQAQGWGLKVERPGATSGSEDATAAVVGYQVAVRTAVRQVLDEAQFAAKARQLCTGLERAGGVERALRILLETAERRTVQK